jgi:hypothetical protein
MVAPLRVCWATQDAASGKRLAPALPGLVAALRRHGELVISDHVAARLVGMSAATIDRRLDRVRADACPPDVVPRNGRKAGHYSA